MSFQPYIANQEMWENHFKINKNSKHKKFQTINLNKQINNEKIALISPIAQGISQAQLDIKRKYEELIKTNPELDIKPINKRKKNQSSSSKRGRKN